jgi:hypothetical protein
MEPNYWGDDSMTLVSYTLQCLKAVHPEVSEPKDVDGDDNEVIGRILSHAEKCGEWKQG